jgi:hypothetical protein
MGMIEVAVSGMAGTGFAPAAGGFIRGMLPGVFAGQLNYHDVLVSALSLISANINFANLLALVGSIFYVGTFVVRTIVPLRILGLVSIFFFLAYGIAAGAIATFIVYFLSLPVNLIRLRQILKLIGTARSAASGDLSLEWLKPFMTPRIYRSGQIVFRMNETASEMCLIVSGSFRVVEIDVLLGPGNIMGELGFAAPQTRRTQTIECTDAGTVLTISYDKLLELYFERPEFSYFILRLTTARLMENVARLESFVIASGHQLPHASAAAVG